MRKVILLYIILFITFCFNSFVFAESVQAVFEQGEQFFAQGEYENAIQYYEKAIGLNPNFAEVYNKLGLAYREMGMDLREVAWYFKAAVDIKPDYADAYVNLARAYYGLGLFDEAEEYCLKALSVHPNIGSAQLSLAWIYLLGKQRPGEAIYYFKQVLETKKIPYAYFGLGIAYFMDNQRPMVLEVITSLRGMDQENLAEQLEGIIRGRYYIPSAPGPLVNKEPLIQGKEGIIVPSGIRGEEVQEEDTTATPVQGMTSIRLRGRLFNRKDASSSEGSSSGTSSLRLEGKPGVIPPSQLRMERIRALQRKQSGY